ncbi:MAG: YitT family protein [Thermodesulfobacteriota bacterium]|nr:YitT family protein [Thermodesulfobacteriota bacterium]
MTTFKEFTYKPLYNILLITAGALLFSFGVEAVVVRHHFIVGGLYGIGLLLYYVTHTLSPAAWFLLLNLPLFIVSWFFISKRFFFYSLYAALAIAGSAHFMNVDAGIYNQLYAAIAGGVLCGAGSGLILRSLGSGGGLDVVAVILYQRFNIGIGKFYLVFNIILFAFFIALVDSVDFLIASLIVVFISTTMIDYMLSLFSNRKTVLIISRKNKEIAAKLINGFRQRATFIKGTGAFSGKDQDILMAITNNIMLKRLEEAVFTIDPDALFVVENTFNVLGTGFGKRKIY